MKNMFNVTTVLPHNLLQTNPCIRHNFSTQVFRKRKAQLHYVGPELRYIFWPFLASKGGQKRPLSENEQFKEVNFRFLKSITFIGRLMHLIV